MWYSSARKCGPEFRALRNHGYSSSSASGTGGLTSRACASDAAGRRGALRCRRAQGRSKPGGRAGLTSKLPFRRNRAVAPPLRSDARSSTCAAQPGGGLRKVMISAARSAVVGQRGRGSRHRNEGAIGKAADAAIGIAGKSGVAGDRGALIAIRGEPFWDRKRVVAEFHGSEPPVGAAERQRHRPLRIRSRRAAPQQPRSVRP